MKKAFIIALAILAMGIAQPLTASAKPRVVVTIKVWAEIGKPRRDCNGFGLCAGIGLGGVEVEQAKAGRTEDGSFVLMYTEEYLRSVGKLEYF